VPKNIHDLTLSLRLSVNTPQARVKKALYHYIIIINALNKQKLRGGDIDISVSSTSKIRAPVLPSSGIDAYDFSLWCV